MTSSLAQVLAAIDDANAKSPTLERDETGADHPTEQLYGQRMSAELDRLFGEDVSDVLKIAARGQHIERWTSKRTDYPEGRAGYLTWRRDLGRFHGERLGSLMAEAGYSAEDCARVGVLLRKEGLKRDAEVQMLEDTICMTFLRHYFPTFATKHPPEKVQDIVIKTARKMSAEGRARVLAEFELPEAYVSAMEAM